MHCAAAEGHLKVFEFLASDPEADLQATTFDGELLEDVVEDEDLRQRVIGNVAFWDYCAVLWIRSLLFPCSHALFSFFFLLPTDIIEAQSRVVLPASNL